MKNNKRFLTAILSMTLVLILSVGSFVFATDRVIINNMTIDLNSEGNLSVINDTSGDSNTSSNAGTDVNQGGNNEQTSPVDGGNATTTDGNATTTIGNATTTDGNATTTDGNATTTDGNATTTNGNATTTDGNATTTNGNATIGDDTSGNYSSGNYSSGNYSSGNSTSGGEVPDPGKTNFDVSGIQDKTYNGKPQTQNLIVKSLPEGRVMVEGVDYIITYSKNVNAGTASVIVTGKGSYYGTVQKTFKIKKAANTLKVTKKTAQLKVKKLKKQSQKLAASKVMNISNANGTLSCKMLSVSKKKYKKYFKMDKSGNLKVKKNLKKGKYKIKTRVTASGDANHNAATSLVTFVVKVK